MDGESGELRISRPEKVDSSGTSKLGSLTSLILGAAAEGIYGLDRHGNTTFANPAAERMLGWETVEIIGRPMHSTLHHSRADGSPYPKDECPIHRTLSQGTNHQVTDEVFWRKDKSSFPVDYTATPIWEEGRVTGAVVTFRDATERKLSETRRHFSQYLQGVPMGVFVIDATGAPIYANNSAVKLLGKDIVPSAKPERLAQVYKAYVAGTETEYPAARMPVVRALSGATSSVDDMEIRQGDGSVDIEVWAAPVYDEAGEVQGAIAVFNDITERKNLQRELASRVLELEQLALKDDLTGLPNRRAFYMLADQQLEAIGRSQMPATMVLLDVEGLEEASRAHGREVIDQWLCAFGQALARVVRKPDFSARLDHSRFAVFAFGDEAHADRLLAQVDAAGASARRAGRWPSLIRVERRQASYNPNRPWGPTEFIEAAANSVAR
ncbi:MAG: sensor domain-containing diguanylate cyclase [Actinomycetota bacterium]|jgi:PAS domain S-box-containing protein